MIFVFVFLVFFLPNLFSLLQSFNPFSLFIVLSVSFIGTLVTDRFIPIVSNLAKTVGITGKDLHKIDKNELPEAQGFAPATVYLVCLIVIQTAVATFTSSKLVEYHAAVSAICFMVLLGFADDVLNIPWRYKIFLPGIASLPLLLAYSGVTDVVLPKLLVALIGQHTIDLGILYYMYMLALAIFCTNSINILAGVNGLEVGQSIVIGCAILVHNLLELDGPCRENHIVSLTLVFPFLACCLPLLRRNWFPARVFVGDTFTFFAGMTLAVCGILGHFSKTLLIFFIPQIFNFLYSLPQLFHFVPCPRHRLPTFNPKTGCLIGDKNQWNLLNLLLVLFGPMSEQSLCIVVLFIQIVTCMFGLFLRHSLPNLVF
uniref:UDP-N-acetylglucosamine--dolichyl-phosphate N-acetylglucosaminephosphotransferase n=1 Tax=Stygiella incarcerata TaxID=1712417 RepID=A0A192ZHE5_9EUKA|nr:UDP-N-acetylglucosamine--dolichyl-phosphate N-acetylglucosaminephosphotransferase [Stygiella incarcerata]